MHLDVFIGITSPCCTSQLMYLCYSTDRPREVGPCPPLHRGPDSMRNRSGLIVHRRPRYYSQLESGCSYDLHRLPKNQLINHSLKTGCLVLQNNNSCNIVVTTTYIFRYILSEFPDVSSTESRQYCIWCPKNNVPLFLTSFAITRHNLPYKEVSRHCISNVSKINYQCIN